MLKPGTRWNPRELKWTTDNYHNSWASSCLEFGVNPDPDKHSSSRMFESSSILILCVQIVSKIWKPRSPALDLPKHSVWCEHSEGGLRKTANKVIVQSLSQTLSFLHKSFECLLYMLGTLTYKTYAWTFQFCSTGQGIETQHSLTTCQIGTIIIIHTYIIFKAIQRCDVWFNSVEFSFTCFRSVFSLRTER